MRSLPFDTRLQVKTPFPVTEQAREKHLTYLDTAGRPVVVLSTKNVVPSVHNQYFQVTYRFSSSTLIREPFLVVIAVFALCFAFMVLTRVDLRISKPRASSPRVAELAAEVANIINKDVAAARAASTAALHKFLSSKNTVQHDNDVKALDQAVHTAIEALGTKATELDAHNKLYASKARELAQLLKALLKEVRELANLEIAFHLENKEGLSQSAYRDKKKAREDAVTAVEDDIVRALAFDD